MGFAIGLGIGLPFVSRVGGPSIAITGTSIAEDAIIGDAIGVLSVANGEGSYTFSITADPDSKFALNGDGVTLELSATVDFETDTSHTVTVEADNGVDDPIVRVITVTVTNVFEAASLNALSLDADDIDENSAEDTVVGAVVGKTTGSTLSLIDDAGGRFKLTGTNIVAGATVSDYEAATSYNITLRETLADSANSPRDTVVPITINDVDEIAPILSNAIDTETGTTTADLSVDTNEGNGTLYWVVSTSATSPTAAQVAAGNDHTGSAAVDSGSQAVSGTGTQTVSGGATGLTAETTYYAHFMHEDAATNQSSVVSGNGFTTEVDVWTPQDLFTSGVTGGWYQVSDLTSLYEERTGGGSTQSSVNGVVGTIRDKSGLGNHLIAASDAARPILRQSGALYYLEFDGVDDVLLSATTMTMTAPVFIGAIILRTSAASHGVAQFGFFQSSNNYAALSANASSEALMQARASGGATLSLATTGAQFANGTTRVLMGRVNSSDGFVQVNNNTEITTSYAGYASPGTVGLIHVNRNVAVASNFYGMIAVLNKTMSTDDRNEARTWLGALGGLTL